MYYCVYMIRNKINNKMYIGQHRYYDENNIMGYYYGSGTIIKEAVKKYGKDNFERIVLYSRIRDPKTVDSMEIWAIEKYKPEYNISPGGSCATRAFSDETKDKIRQTLLRKHITHTDEFKCNASKRWIGNQIGKGRFWFNNGQIEVMQFECPDGFKPGRIGWKSRG